MNLQDLEELIDSSVSSFPGVRDRIFKWWESQKGINGIRAIGYRARSINGELDSLSPRVERRKDGISRRGSYPGGREVDNAKRRGIKALHKKTRRQSIRGFYGHEYREYRKNKSPCKEGV